MTAGAFRDDDYQKIIDAYRKAVPDL